MSLTDDMRPSHHRPLMSRFQDRPRLSAPDKSCARVPVEASAGEDSLEARGNGEPKKVEAGTGNRAGNAPLPWTPRSWSACTETPTRWTACRCPICRGTRETPSSSRRPIGPSALTRPQAVLRACQAPHGTRPASGPPTEVGRGPPTLTADHGLPGTLITVSPVSDTAYPR